MTHFDKIIRRILRECINERFNHADNGDEFYTRQEDIANEVSNYDLSGKIIYCPCDDPSFSSFWKYFYENFHNLGLKGLYATYYSDRPMLYYYDGQNVQSRQIRSGRFQDNGEIFKLCDVVVTNPPYSDNQSKQMFNMARQFGKDILMVSRKTFIGNNEMFQYIKNGELRNGYTSINKFNRPDGSVGKAPSAWYTTLPQKRGNYQSGVRYNDNYRKYDNYDAIDVSDYRQIPDDYDGMIGVPYNGDGFLRVHNPEQYEIVDKIRRPSINGKRVGGDRMIIRKK